MFNIRDDAVHSIECTNLDGLSVSWFLGSKCVYSCSYCPDRFHNDTSPYHSIEKVLRLCNQLPDKTNITFLGGEPTYHPDFERIVLEKPSHIKLSVLTNGARPLEFWERISHNLDTVTFSFHAEFANLDRFIENAIAVRNRAKTFRMFLLMHPEKWDYCVEAYDRLKSIGSPILVKPILTHSPELNQFDEVDPKYTDEQLKWIAEKNFVNNNIIILDKDRNVLHRTNANTLIANIQTDFSGFKCYVPQQHITVRMNENICNSMCSQRNIIGHLDDEVFTLPTEPIICRQTRCQCQADLVTTKIKQ
jgi:organic radical activating enzyme